MSDVAKWKVHGPVKTLRTESATWDLNQQDWQPTGSFSLTTFRTDGTVSTSETHNPDGSIARWRWLYNDANQLAEYNSWFNDDPIERTIYFYDEAGRHTRTAQEGPDGTQTDTGICTYDADGKKTSVRLLGLHGAKVSYGIEGTEISYPAPGATTMTTTYDEKDLPTKVVFQDANHNPVTRVIFVRDSAGRILNEQMHIDGESIYRDFLDKVPPEGGEGLVATYKKFKKAIGKPFSGTTYFYDTRGRLLERTIRMGSLNEDRTTYHYDDHDDPVEEITEHKNRDASVDENGTVHYSSDCLSVQLNRTEYRYDTHANWTERIVSIRPEQNPGFQPSNIERRAITYHAG